MLDLRMNVTGKDTLLSVRGLSTWFELRRWGFGHAGIVRAIDALSFDLLRGEAVAIVGESGCGKSTLARTILGLHRPNEGEIVFNDENISHLPRKRLQWYRSQVGYIQQDPYGALVPFLQVHQALQEPLIINGIKNKSERTTRINQALNAVRLSPPEAILSKYPHMLSGGQQQRVVIARAMILHPKLIVADEPVSMLDASVRVETLQLLKDLQLSNNLSVIYVTHDLATLRYFSQRVFVMYAGEIIEKAGVDRLLDSAFHPYCKALITAIPDPDPTNATTLREVPPGEPPSLLNPPSGCRFHPRCSYIIRGLCEHKRPPEFEPHPEHFVNCWLFEK